MLSTTHADTTMICVMLLGGKIKEQRALRLGSRSMPPRFNPWVAGRRHSKRLFGSKVAEINSAVAVGRYSSYKGSSEVLQHSMSLRPSSMQTDLANVHFLDSVGESRTRTAASHQEVVPCRVGCSIRA